MNQGLIRTEDLTYYYNEADRMMPLPVLRGVDLEIEQGTFTAILGHNGSGK